MRWKQGIYCHGPQPVLVLSVRHLREKPLSYFVTTNGNQGSTWNSAIRRIKTICGFTVGKGIVRIGYYYLQAHLSFPLQVWPLTGGRFQVVVYSATGLRRLFVCIYATGKHGRMTRDDVDRLGMVLKEHSDALSSAMAAVEPLKPATPN